MRKQLKRKQSSDHGLLLRTNHWSSIGSHCSLLRDLRVARVPVRLNFRLAFGPGRRLSIAILLSEQNRHGVCKRGKNAKYGERRQAS